MMFILSFWLSVFTTGLPVSRPLQERKEVQIIYELYRFRNLHKPDSAEQFFADTVKVYMKYLRNVHKRKITESDRQFWKAHPKNKFEITGTIKIIDGPGTSTAIFTGKEYLDGINYRNEKIEIVFNRYKKIISFRGLSIKKTD